MNLTYHIRVLGHVQGVGFRYHMVRKARDLGVNGWVRNRRDGSVEAMAQGAKDALERLLEWTRHGPTNARVTDVQVSEGDGSDASYGRFETRPTE